MNETTQIGLGTKTIRKDAWEKVTGKAKYNEDTLSSDMLHGRMFVSPYAHALITNIDTREAEESKGVRAVVIGKDVPVLTGSSMEDRPILARDKVRYFGEPIALVVADSEQEAAAAVNLIKVDYEHLPVVNSISDAIKENAILIHENMKHYYCPDPQVYPIPDTNIAHHAQTRKGDINKAFKESDVIVEYNFSMPKASHLSMETRNARAEISPGGTVTIYASTQAPFGVKEEISSIFGIPEGKVVVHSPLVGGAFGGKASTQLEFLAYVASNAVDGRLVRIANPREQDIASSPSKIGAEANLKLGATKDGKLKGLECTYYVEYGAYSDTGPGMVRAVSSDFSGPYKIENVSCDAYGVYTNHVYCTSFRGFSHSASVFGIEGAMSKLAEELNMDLLELRRINAIKTGDLSATGVKMTMSNSGNLEDCIFKLKDLIKWDEGNRIVEEDGKIRAKGIACFWKTSSSPVTASSGVLATFNSDGSVNINFGATEIGPGTKTTIGQIFAEKMQMNINDVDVYMDVNTQITPLHWKTVASMSTIMIGNAAVKAAEDLIRQLKELGARILECNPEDLEVKNKRVFVANKPNIFLNFKDIVHGYQYKPRGPGVYGQILGHGTYIMEDLIELNSQTGQGVPGVSWTVGAQAVEIEYDPDLHTYRLLTAVTVPDIGKVINPNMARGVVMGGMNMGLGLATRETFQYDENGILQDNSIRTYKVMHINEQPKYLVDFIENPQSNTPFGARGIGEHGVIGMPAALANAISIATEKEFNTVPISPQLIWETVTGGKR